MSDKVKNVVVSVLFVGLILCLLLFSVLKKPSEVSKSERRKLAQFPAISYETLENGEFMESFDKYSLDQFVGRDWFRQLKANVLFYIFRQKDNNNIYLADGQVSKYYNQISKDSVVDAGKKFNKLYNQYLKEMNVYYSIIPDKNYFLAAKNGYPSVDYKEFENYLTSTVNSNMKYISLFDSLQESDYYATDIHWRQEKISKVVEKLGNEMGFSVNNNYTLHELSPFYGVYYGQSALPIESEKLYYLTNEAIENARVYELNEKTLTMEESQIYDENDFENIDPYDVFLKGPRPLFVIKNENATTDKELILFRDSFGSSLAPLLVESYRKITIVDLRYIGSPLLKDYVEFNDGQDVLIIYCTDILNDSSLLKVF